MTRSVILRLAVGAALVCGCGESSSARLERLAACAVTSEQVFTADAATRLAAMGSGRMECATELWRGCSVKDADVALALFQQAETERVPVIALSCTRMYCDRLAPAPALCGGHEVLRGADVAAAREAAAEFLAAMLAFDLAIDRDDPRVRTIAATFSRLWAVEAMRAELMNSPAP